MKRSRFPGTKRNTCGWVYSRPLWRILLKRCMKPKSKILHPRCLGLGRVVRQNMSAKFTRPKPATTLRANDVFVPVNLCAHTLHRRFLMELLSARLVLAVKPSELGLGIHLVLISG